MNNWNELKHNADYKKWNAWKMDQKRNSHLFNYASALCFGLAAIVEAVAPIV